MTATYCPCFRPDLHDPHEWEGVKRWRQDLHAWVKPLYWCAGYRKVEGGWHGDPR